MFSNYVKLTFRNLFRKKTFSLLNILGLAIGITACLFILQYVSFELSYDRFHANASNIYRVINDRYQNGKLMQHGTITYSAIGKAMKDDFAEVVQNARVSERGSVIISYNDKKLSENHTLAVDNSFLQMFSFPLLAGNPATALTDAYTIVVSENLVRKVFSYQGNDLNQFVGKALVFFNEERPYKITGICRNVPENSHLQFNLLISYATIIDSWKEADHSFRESSFWHYIQLKPGTDYKALQTRFDAFSKRHFDGSKVSGSIEKFYLQPLLDAHLYSDFEYEIGIVGSSTVVWSLFVIALFIISIAWINYINLATAKAVDRAKEVGVRKVLGAYRGQLIGQFLSEAFLINCIGLFFALALVYFLQPSFNNLLGRQHSLAFLFEHGLGGSLSIAGLIGIMLVGILLSGFYPAFVLSSFMPITVLKGKYSTSRRGIALRKALVVGQFTATIVLIVGSLMVYRQMKYVSSKELGLNMDQILVIHPPQLTIEDSTFKVRIESFKNAVKGLTGVKGATTTRNLPGDELGRAFNVHRTDASDDTRFTTRLLSVSYDFTDVYDIKLIAGRKHLPSDYNAEWDKVHNLVVNKKAVALLGFASPEEAIGKSISVFNDKKMEIVGVMDDYHQKSLHSPIEPILVFPSYGNGDPISVKVATNSLPQTMAAIRKHYEAFFPGNLFDYFFLKERYNQQYKDDTIFSKVFGLFAGFAIFIACLGLFGLSLFTTAQRTKEISTRKVLGASAFQIVGLLSRDFLKLIILAITIAIPLGWYAINMWLENFAYSTSIRWWVFVVAGLTALVIAFLTISFQAIKAALDNPVKSLRTE